MAGYIPHAVSEWAKRGLLFCASCAAYGATIGQGLRGKCEGGRRQEWPGRCAPNAALEAERARQSRQMHDQELLAPHAPQQFIRPPPPPSAEPPPPRTRRRILGQPA
eukprot:7251508-Pyramimonas_sp.AAC.1